MSDLPTISGYEILETVGSGGTSDVYKARDAAGAIVAIKVVREEVTDPEIRGRFEREALAASRIDHPSCVRVRDVGALDDGRFYLAMDYVEGNSLTSVIAEGPMDVERALNIADELLAGLQVAHEAEVIHRDIKPDNISLEPGAVEHARLLDFGLAKLFGAAGAATEPLTAAGMAVGTPVYMPPEWLTSGELGPSADLYSLSVVLYEMIAGAPPYTSDDALETLTMHVKEPIPELPLPEDQVGAEAIRALVARGLAKDPEKRYADAAEYRAAIAAVGSEIGDKKTLLMASIPKVAPGPTAEVAPPAPSAPLAPSLPPPVVTDALAPTVDSASASVVAPGSANPISTPPVAAVPAVATAPLGMRVKQFASRYRRPLLAGAVGVVLVGAVIAASGGTESASAGVDAGKTVESAQPPTGIDAVIRQWRDAGLKPGGLADIADPPLGAERCRTGAAAGIDITVCEFASATAASAATKAAQKTIGAHTGAAVASGAMLLIVSDRKGVDPSGKSINALINKFAGSN